MIEAPKLTVLILTLNEAASLVRLLPRIEGAVAEISSHEVLVIDGGSTDGTQDFARKSGARVVAQAETGYGNAYRQGLREARGEWILTIDADGSHPVEEFPKLWERRAGAALVAGSRYLPGGGDGRPLLRRSLSRAVNAAYASVLRIPLTDIGTGLRLYNRQAAAEAETAAKDFDVVSETTVRLWMNGGKIVEVPFRYVDRSEGVSKARLLAYSLSYARTLVRLLRDMRS
jgi:dolichol-phosphate mannosyltransferase